MKCQFLFLIIFLPFSGIAQDIIEMKDGATHKVRVVQEEKKVVHFYYTKDPEKELVSLPKKQIRKIRYQDIPKEADVIRLIMASLQDDDLFASVVRHLLQAGYQIGTINNDALIMESDYKDKHRITIQVEGNTVEFISYYTEEEVGYPPKGEVVWGKDSEPEENRVHAWQSRFRVMDEVCRLFLKENKGELVYDQE